MRHFAVEAFRSFLGTRGAFAGLAFSLLPAGAMCLGLALQSSLAVELGMDDDQVAWLNLWSSVVSAVFMVVGGLLSDKLGRRRTLAVYLALMSPPVLYMMWMLQQHGWVMPVDPNLPNRPLPPAVLVTALWIATLTYAVAQGLMYGTRSAIMMDVTNPAVAATQFTAYMALANLAIAYSSVWQGIAAEALGYPATMLIDAVTGLLCIALLPWMKGVRGNVPDGGAPTRARWSAAVLGLACLAWLPYRLGQSALGAAVPIFESLFTVVFVASALFLLAGAAVLQGAGRRLTRLGAWLAPLLLVMYARRWVDDLAAGLGHAARPNPVATAADVVLLAVPAAAGLVLLALAWRNWRELAPAPAAEATLPTAGSARPLATG
jgi:PAT family beta-lactamase induction signal transducer AmpG